MTTIIPNAINKMADLTTEISDECKKLSSIQLSELIHQADELETSAKGSAILAVKLTKEVAMITRGLK